MDFSVFNRQTVRGFVIIFLLKLKTNTKIIWNLIPFLYVIRKSDYSYWTIFIVFLLLYVGLSLLTAIVRYRTFLFRIEENSFVSKEGLFRKKETIIPFDKIVNVNFRQNIVHQIFDIIQIEIETAGAKNTEIKIESLDKNVAMQLKEILLQQVNTETTTFENFPKFLQQISIKELVMVGLSENHFRSLVLISLFFWTIYSKLEDFFGETVTKKMVFDEAEKSVEFLSVWLAIGFAITLIVVSILVSLVKTIIKHYRLTTLVKDDTIEIKQGLIDYKQIIINTSKIQFLTIISNPIKKMLNIRSISFFQASSGKIKLNNLIKTVGVNHSQKKKILNFFYSEDFLKFEKPFGKLHSQYLKVLLLTRVSLFVLISIVCFFVFDQYRFNSIYWIVFELTILFILILTAIFKYKRFSYNYNDKIIQINKGYFSYSSTYFEYRKIQSIQLKQTFFQKKKHTASLKLITASGNLKIPYIAFDKAIEMYNHILTTAEKSTKKWM